MYTYSNEQFLFDRILAGLAIALKWIWKLILYSPLWFTAYIFSTYILDKQAPVLAWLGLIILMSLALYQVIFFLKGLIIGFMDSHRIIWIPLFIICVLFSTVLPVWLMFDGIYQLMVDVYPGQADLLTWIGAIALALLIYSRYHFLTDMAPTIAFPMYRFGLNLSSHL